MRVEEVVGTNLKTRREELDVTQEEVARKVGELLQREWTRQTVYVAEKGGRNFTAAELLALAGVLNTTVEWLFRLPVGVHRIDLPGGGFTHRQLIEHQTTDYTDPERFLYEMRETVALLNSYITQGLDPVAEMSEKLDELKPKWAAEREKGRELVEKAWRRLESFATALTDAENTRAGEAS